jgi:hypothetical protein
MGLLLVAVLTLLCITKRQELTRKSVCDRCGAKLWATTDSVAGAPDGAKERRLLEATELSQWFDSNIDTNCAHTWVQIHTSGRTYVALGKWRLCNISGGSGGQVTPHLTYLFPDDRAQLETLLKGSSKKCSNFIHERLQQQISGKDD